MSTLPKGFIVAREGTVRVRAMRRRAAWSTPQGVWVLVTARIPHDGGISSQRDGFLFACLRPRGHAYRCRFDDWTAIGNPRGEHIQIEMDEKRPKGAAGRDWWAKRPTYWIEGAAYRRVVEAFLERAPSARSLEMPE